MGWQAVDLKGAAAISGARARQRLVDLTRDYSIEVTPKTLAKQADIGALFPERTRLYIACLPGDPWQDVVTAAERVRANGFIPVPHIAARSLRDQADFQAYVEALTQRAKVDQVLVIGGGIDRPVGALSGTTALLETGILEGHGIKVIGLAGHPEGHRDLPKPAVAATLEDKWAYAAKTGAECRLVTQFLFDADPLLAWERALRAHGNSLPIHVGIPGPATLKTLLTYGRMCGVGNSMRVLTRRGGSLLRLAGLSYPDRLLTALAHHQAGDADTRIARLHLYPFGGIGRTARWINAVREGRFDMHRNGLGFTVDAEPG